MNGFQRLIEEASRSYSLAILAAAFVVIPLLRAFAVHDRRRRRAVLGVVAIHLLLIPIIAVGSEDAKWVPIARIVSSLAGATAIVLMVGAVLFVVVLPKLRLEPPRIIQDLLMGAAILSVGIPVASMTGVDVSGLLATSAVLTAVVGFALQDTLGNFFSGLALQLDDSIRIGDWLRIGDHTGKVTSFRWRYVSIETRNWETLVIPNSVLTKEHVLVLGKRKGQPQQWRRWVYFNVDYRYQPSDVIEAVTLALRATPIEDVARTPPPNCVAMDFTDSYCRYAVRYWLTDLAVDDPTDSVVRTRVYFALKRVGIPLALPAHRLFVRERSDDGTLARNAEEQERAEMLSLVPLFSPLSTEELRTVARHARYAPFTKGETMTHQGAKAHWLYVIIEGEASVHVATEDGRSTQVGRIHAYDFFGEMGLMTGAPRAATVIAETDVECFRVDSEGFEEILRKRPEIAEEIATILTKRRRELATALESLGPVPEQEAALLDRIKKFFSL